MVIQKGGAWSHPVHLGSREVLPVVPWDRRDEARAAVRKALDTTCSIVESNPFLVVGREDPAYLTKLANTVLVPYFSYLTERLEVNKDWSTLYVFVAEDHNEFSNIANRLYMITPDDKIAVEMAMAFSDLPGRATMAICGAEASNCTAFAHELFHFVNEESFEDAPWWLYEGMAELFESGDVRDGAFYPRPGWRKGKAEMDRLDTESFQALLTLSRNDPSLYHPPGAVTAMARARFFCYYLHEKGLLFPIYKELKNRDWVMASADPSGIRVIEKNLSGKSIDAVAKDFKTWFMEKIEPLPSPDKP